MRAKCVVYQIMFPVVRYNVTTKALKLKNCTQFHFFFLKHVFSYCRFINCTQADYNIVIITLKAHASVMQ